MCPVTNDTYAPQKRQDFLSDRISSRKMFRKLITLSKVHHRHYLKDFPHISSPENG